MKKNQLNLELFPDEEEIIEDTELEDAEVDALADETGEQALSESTAEADALTEEAGATNIINVSLSEIPQLENLQPGDEVDLITTFKVNRSSDGTFDIEPIAYTPVEELESPELEEPGGAAPVGGGGIEAALGGGAPVV